VPACDHFGQELTGGKDDRVFRLDRVKDACCWNEAVLKAIIIDITLMLSAAATRPLLRPPTEVARPRRLRHVAAVRSLPSWASEQGGSAISSE
jgi:hypothetical protein